jgi:hypothetical protein
MWSLYKGWQQTVPSRQTAPVAARVFDVILITGFFGTVLLSPVLVVLIITFRLRGAQVPACLDLFSMAALVAVAAISSAYAGVDIGFWRLAPYCLAFMAAGSVSGCVEVVLRRMPRRSLILPAIAILSATAYALHLVGLVRMAGGTS